MELIPERLAESVVQEIRGTHTTVYLPFEFDWKNPDYLTVFQHRAIRLMDLRQNPERFVPLDKWYAQHPAQMITDWGCTYDPRNLERGLPAIIPFILFPKQIDWIDWVLDRWHSSEPGLTEKSRDCGVSWLAMCLSAELCRHNQAMSIGVGSSKADKVDRTDDPDCLLFKARFYLKHIPTEFSRGWNADQHSAYMRVTVPKTGSGITGEAGDQIGRGGRKAMYFVDEAAHLERPQTIESSLLSNTNCRIDMSSVAGMGNPFARKRHQGKVKYFTFHWRDDPRKGVEWYEHIKATTDAVSLAQDVDINYMASVGGQVIPSEYVQAAVGAFERLGLRPTGLKYAGFDPADEGEALNALAMRHGSVLFALKQWSGAGSDLYASTVTAINYCDEYGLSGMDYDADGLGAGVRGDAIRINQARVDAGLRRIFDSPFRGSGKVDSPNSELVAERKNEDFFLNLKAQSWWALRLRFEATYRAIVKGMEIDPDTMISIDPNIENLGQLLVELSQPTYKKTENGKLVVQKMPDGSASPNLADAVMIAYNPTAGWFEIWERLARG